MKQENKKFQVSVIECNSQQFNENYYDYIYNAYLDDFDNTIFSMETPQDIYLEIANLQEEGIIIL